MIDAWLKTGRAPVPGVSNDPDLVETRRQITALEQRIDRLVDGYRRAGEAYRRR
jgi:hypothetical protein